MKKIRESKISTIRNKILPQSSKKCRITELRQYEQKENKDMLKRYDQHNSHMTDWKLETKNQK